VNSAAKNTRILVSLVQLHFASLQPLFGPMLFTLVVILDTISQFSANELFYLYY